uniref:Immunoglobulin V-set domain-containing protein n=1 Tax=Poecilia formosa TaxID=48698 RepID=A0A096M0L7_POEFO
MKPSVVFITIACWIEGVYLSKEKQVSQFPADVLVRPNNKVNLTFTHTIKSYDTILWYQRSPGDTSLKLIGYVYYTSVTMESEFKSHFQVTGDGEKMAQLHILNPRNPEDSG